MLHGFAEEPLLVMCAPGAAPQDTFPYMSCPWPAGALLRGSRAVPALCGTSPVAQRGFMWSQQHSSASSSVLIAFADCVKRLAISSCLPHAVFGASPPDHISAVYRGGGGGVTFLDFVRLIMCSRSSC